MIAFICSTPIHIMRSIQLKIKYEEFRDEEAEIYVTNTFEKSKDIVKKLHEIGLFNNIIEVPSFIKHEKYELMFGRTIVSKHIRNMFYKKILVFSKESSIAVAVYSCSCMRGKTKLFLCEDAPSGLGLGNKITMKYGLFHRLLGIKPIVPNSDVLFMSWNSNNGIPYEFRDKLVQLPFFSKKDKDVSLILNKIFDYKDDNEITNADILYMQDAYVADGTLDGSGEITFLENVQRKYPEKKIIVKPHPRNKNNIFRGKFEIVKSQEIPWELYCLNMDDYSDRVPIIIGTACSTMVSDKLAANKEFKKITVMDYFLSNYWKGIERLKKNRNIFLDSYISVKQKYINPNRFIFCSTLEDVYSAMENMENE